MYTVDDNNVPDCDDPIEAVINERCKNWKELHMRRSDTDEIHSRNKLPDGFIHVPYNFEWNNAALRWRYNLEDPHVREDGTQIFDIYNPTKKKFRVEYPEYANVRNKNGDTPLHVSTSSEAVMALLGWGADATLFNSAGKLPYQTVNFVGSKTTTSMLKALQRKHPEPRRRDLRFFVPNIDNFNRSIHDNKDRALQGLSLI